MEVAQTRVGLVVGGLEDNRAEGRLVSGGDDESSERPVPGGGFLDRLEVPVAKRPNDDQPGSR